MMKKILMWTITLMGLVVIPAQESVSLYDGRVPGSENWTWEEAEMYSDLFKTEVVYNVVEPSMLIFTPPKGVHNTGTSIIIAPGGGFQSLSINREGVALAQLLAQKGITAFVLKYRLLETKTGDPAREMMENLKDRQAFEKKYTEAVKLAAEDAKQAMKYVRKNAGKYNLDLTKVGCIGFSAGGAVVLETVLGNSDQMTQPNFVASIYGAPRDELLNKEVPALAIPLFICAASDDQLKLVPKSMMLYNKWLEKDYPVELHLYEKGGHGFGTGIQNLPVDAWTQRFMDWLKLNDYMK